MEPRGIPPSRFLRRTLKYPHFRQGHGKVKHVRKGGPEGTAPCVESRLLVRAARLLHPSVVQVVAQVGQLHPAGKLVGPDPLVLLLLALLKPILRRIFRVVVMTGVVVLYVDMDGGNPFFRFEVELCERDVW